MPQKNGFTEGRSAVKSGKLIKVQAKFKEDRIVEIKITGDFFIYPEDAIEILENELRGKKIDEIGEIIENILRNCEYIGIEPESLETAVIEAWRKRK